MKKNNQLAILDHEEAAIEQALAKGDYISSKNLSETKLDFKQAAKQFIVLQKTKPITLRINQLDLLKVRAKAKLKNIPYQTLLSSLIHQYAEGQTNLAL